MNRTLDSVQYFSGNEIASFWEFLVKANIFLTVWYEAFPPIKGRRKGSRESSYQAPPVFTALRDYPISPSLLPTLRQHDVKTAMSNFTESQPKTKKQQQKKENNGPFLYVKICEAFQSTGEAQHELLGGKKRRRRWRTERSRWRKTWVLLRGEEAGEGFLKIPGSKSWTAGLRSTFHLQHVEQKSLQQTLKTQS